MENTQNKQRLLLVGYGKMGKALFKGWRKLSHVRLSVLSPSLIRCPEGAEAYYTQAQDCSSKHFDIVVYAIKPQVLELFLDQTKLWGKVHVSIAAGKEISFFEDRLGASCPVVRAMPNTPSQIGKGMTALYANKACSPPLKQEVDILLKAVGETLWLKEESKMDAVTALSGSGPAYVFLFLETLIKSAEKLGLSSEEAKTLAITTLEGSAILAKNSDLSPLELRQAVTSPKGTTEAGLSILTKENALETLVFKAMEAAYNRSIELRAKA